jgi:tetratricopeptide (TPR) repeat protein
VPRILFVGVLFVILPLQAFGGDLERGLEALNKKDYDLAIACYNAYIRENSKDAAGHIGRGEAYRGKKNYDKAIEDFSEAIRLDPNSALGYINRAGGYHDKKEYHKAIKDHDEVIRLLPKSAATYFLRATDYYNNKEYDKAIKDYEEAIRLKPKFDAAYNGLAWILATCPKDSVRDGKKAIEFATKACELSQWKEANNLDTLAAANAEAGNFKEAVKWAKQVIELGLHDKAETEKARHRLNLYEQRKPFRDDRQ